jgi:hypothetical protein
MLTGNNRDTLFGENTDDLDGGCTCSRDFPAGQYECDGGSSVGDTTGNYEINIGLPVCVGLEAQMHSSCRAKLHVFVGHSGKANRNDLSTRTTAIGVYSAGRSVARYWRQHSVMPGLSCIAKSTSLMNT